MKYLVPLGLALSLISCQQQPTQTNAISDSADPRHESVDLSHATASSRPSSAGVAALAPPPSQESSHPPPSGQTRISSFDNARDDAFWPKLYPGEGYSLYCNYRFDNQGSYVNHTGKTVTMSVEHVYSADWIATHFGCANRGSCHIDEFHFAAADLHNLWAADQGVNSSRRDHPFAEIPDNESETRFKNRGCDDFERTYGGNARVEPRDAVKGQIARSLLYMRDTYGFSLLGMNDLSLQWHHNYPVTAEELQRNEKIFIIQGTRNPWIGGAP